jgi:hypothetical protein
VDYDIVGGFEGRVSVFDCNTGRRLFYFGTWNGLPCDPVGDEDNWNSDHWYENGHSREDRVIAIVVSQDGRSVAVALRNGPPPFEYGNPLVVFRLDTQ